jgi:hypothetical protein
MTHDHDHDESGAVAALSEAWPGKAAGIPDGAPSRRRAGPGRR